MDVTLFYLLLLTSLIGNMQGAEYKAPCFGSQLIFGSLRVDEKSTLSWHNVGYSAHDINQIRLVNRFLCNTVDEAYTTLCSSFTELKAFKPLLLLCSPHSEWCCVMHPRVEKLDDTIPLTIFFGTGTEHVSKYIFCDALPAHAVFDRVASVAKNTKTTLFNLILNTNYEKTLYELQAGVSYNSSIFPASKSVHENTSAMLGEYSAHAWVEKKINHEDWHSKQLFINPYGSLRIHDKAKPRSDDLIFMLPISNFVDQDAQKQLLKNAQKQAALCKEKDSYISYSCASEEGDNHSKLVFRLLSAHGLCITLLFVDYNEIEHEIIKRDNKHFLVTFPQRNTLNILVALALAEDNDLLPEYQIYGFDKNYVGEFFPDRYGLTQNPSHLRYIRNVQNHKITSISLTDRNGDREIILTEPKMIAEYVVHKKTVSELFAGADLYDKILHDKGTMTNPLTSIPTLPLILSSEMQKLKDYPLYCSFKSLVSRLWCAGKVLHDIRLCKPSPAVTFMERVNTACSAGTAGSLLGLIAAYYADRPDWMIRFLYAGFSIGSGFVHYESKNKVTETNQIWKLWPIRISTIVACGRMFRTLNGSTWHPTILGCILPFCWMAFDFTALTLYPPDLCIPFKDIYASCPAWMQRNCVAKKII